MKDCCIIVVAEGIPQDVVDRFQESVTGSSPRVSVDIEILTKVEGRERQLGFCKAAGLNQLLRKTLNKYRVIIQTDIDLLIPPRLLDVAYNTVVGRERVAYHHYLRHVQPEEIAGKPYHEYPWDQWGKRKAIFCSGCFNAMTSKTWEGLRGYPEVMVDWGAEDTWFFQRSKRLGVRWVIDASYGLVHVNHPPRTEKRAKENLSAVSCYADESNWLTGVLMKIQ